MHVLQKTYCKHKVSLHSNVLHLHCMYFKIEPFHIMNFLTLSDDIVIETPWYMYFVQGKCVLYIYDQDSEDTIGNISICSIWIWWINWLVTGNNRTKRGLQILWISFFFFLVNNFIMTRTTKTEPTVIRWNVTTKLKDCKRPPIISSEIHDIKQNTNKPNWMTSWPQK